MPRKTKASAKKQALPSPSSMGMMFGDPQMHHMPPQPMDFPQMMDPQMKAMPVFSGPQLQQYHAQLVVYRQITENKPVSQNLLFMSDGPRPAFRPGFSGDPNIMNPDPNIQKIQMGLKMLSQEAKELYLLSEVSVLNHIPSPLEFYREWVSPNKPVILKGAVKNWPALTKWSDKYLRKCIGEKEVTVAVTPNGYADAPYEEYFVMPEERSMKFSQFLDIMKDPSKTNGIFYVQKQNSNLTDEFKEIIGDVKEDVSWFSEALGKKPDAVNFWMGDERAITSMHKDNYENIYCVIRGHKDFILQPPTDCPWIPYRKYSPAVYKYDDESEKFSIEEVKDSPPVPWICIDPLDPDYEYFPQYRNSLQIKCRVEEGDALFLPSLWFHHVRQSHACIAVNYWYDMEYDLKYNYYQLLQNLTWNKDDDDSDTEIEAAMAEVKL